MNYVLVFIGGGLGCVIRYLIGLLFLKSDLSLPVATLISNVAACLIFVIVLAFINLKPDLAPFSRPLLLTGFCGGLSTFSAFSYESYLLFQRQMYFVGFANILLSCLLCVSLFFILNKFQA